MRELRPRMSGSEKFQQLVNRCTGTIGAVTRLRQATAKEIAMAETKALHYQTRADYHESQIDADTGSGLRANTPQKSWAKNAAAARGWKAYGDSLREELNTALETATAEASLPPL